ncbi:MAG: hypothetical protein ACKO7W_21945 [Elainella sp.]
MTAEQVDGFADNWAYLRSELLWLERLLMTAVAKQRKEAKEIDRIAQSKADRATSHWWKGIITTDGTIAYDEYRQPASGSKATYHSQLEAQIQAARKQGIVLALPNLRDRLGLNLFEKNLVLISLAPEVNRRYARLYRFLQGDETSKTDLPTLDLALRLFCKNDQEWRSARNHLVSSSRLLHHQLLEILPEDTVLNGPLRLNSSVINYLLAEQPSPKALEDLLTAPAALSPAQDSKPSISIVARSASLVWLQHQPAAVVDSSSLPSSALTALTSLEQRIQGYLKAVKQWKIPAKTLPPPGLIVLLSGPTEADRTLAASLLAQSLHKTLLQVNLATVDPADYPRVIEEMITQSPMLLLIQSAELWLRRSALPPALLQRLWAERRRLPAITLFSVTRPTGLPTRHPFDQQIHLPPTDAATRQIIWQQAFPTSVPLDATINWPQLADLELNREQIERLAQEAIAYAAVNSAEAVELGHIVQALVQRGIAAKIQPLKPKRTRRPRQSKAQEES